MCKRCSGNIESLHWKCWPPVPSTLVKILGESSQDLGVGEIGEIAVSGPQVMREYWKNEEETNKVLLKMVFSRLEI